MLTGHISTFLLSKKLIHWLWVILSHIYKHHLMARDTEQKKIVILDKIMCWSLDGYLVRLFMWTKIPSSSEAYRLNKHYMKEENFSSLSNFQLRPVEKFAYYPTVYFSSLPHSSDEAPHANFFNEWIICRILDSTNFSSIEDFIGR